MKLKNYVFFFLLFSLSFSSFSQEEKKKPIEESESIKVKSDFWKKVRFGGGMGLDFSNNGTSVSVSPSAVYQVNNKFSTGAGVNFGYRSFKTNSARQFNYGISLINLYNPFNGLQLSGDFEYTFVNESFKQDGEKFTRDFNFPALYLGAGYQIGHISAGFR